MKNSSVTDCKQIFWHQDILGFHEGSSLLIYGQAKALEDLNPTCVTENIVFMKVTVLKVTKDTKDEVIQEPVMTNTEDPSAAGMNTKKYLTKVGKAVMPSMIQKETIKIPLQEKTDEKTDEKSTERLDKNQSEKYSMELQNPVAKPVLSGDVINMIITENRLQNTELRLSVMKMNVIRHLHSCGNPGGNPKPTSRVERVFYCSLCPKRFFKESYIKLHIKRYVFFDEG